MKITKILCDRCQKPMTYNGWTAIIKYPKVKRCVSWQIRELFYGNISGYEYCNLNTELCADCSKQLKQWLKGENYDKDCNQKSDGQL